LLGAPKTDVEPASEGFIPNIFVPPDAAAPNGEEDAPDPKGFAPNGFEEELELVPKIG